MGVREFVATLLDDIRAVRAWMNAPEEDDGRAGHHGWDHLRTHGTEYPPGQEPPTDPQENPHVPPL